MEPSTPNAKMVKTRSGAKTNEDREESPISPATPQVAPSPSPSLGNPSPQRRQRLMRHQAHGSPRPKNTKEHEALARARAAKWASTRPEEETGPGPEPENTTVTVKKRKFLRKIEAAAALGAESSDDEYDKRISACEPGATETEDVGTSSSVRGNHNRPRRYRFFPGRKRSVLAARGGAAASYQQKRKHATGSSGVENAGGRGVDMDMVLNVYDTGYEGDLESGCESKSTSTRR